MYEHDKCYCFHYTPCKFHEPAMKITNCAPECVKPCCDCCECVCCECRPCCCPRPPKCPTHPQCPCFDGFEGPIAY